MTSSPWGDDPPGATPLDAEEFEQLIPTHIATRADLNAAERDNILDARVWAFTRNVMSVDALLQISMVDVIHRRMFDHVWQWAGRRRTRSTNIGVEPAQIVMQLRDALDDATFWHTNVTFGPHEIAVRIHHRLVQVHPYVNGNGRHARFIADLYLHLIGEASLPWKPGESDLSESRDAYISALREADRGDYSSLIAYAVG